MAIPVPAGPGTGAIAPVHEQPAAAMRRLRLFAGVLLVLGVIQLVTGHFGLFTIAGIIISFLGMRAAKKPNTTHLRVFSCWNSCMAGFAIAGGIVALLLATPLLSCACDAGCVDAAYDVIQDGRSWVLNNTVNGTFLPDRAFNASNRASFPTGVFFPPPRDHDDVDEEDGDHDRRLAAAVSNLRSPAAGDGAAVVTKSQTEAAAPSQIHPACPHAGHFGKLGRIIGGWLHRRGFGGRHRHGGHGHGKWVGEHGGHRRPAADAGHDSGFVPPPMGDPVPAPGHHDQQGVSVLRNDRPQVPPIMAQPDVDVDAPMHILPFPMPEQEAEPALPVDTELPTPRDMDHTAWGRVRRHFAPRHHAGLRMRHVFKSLLHALFEPLAEAPREPHHAFDRTQVDEPQPVDVEVEVEEGDDEQAQGRDFMEELDSTTTLVAAPAPIPAPARPGVRRLIAMRRLLSNEAATPLLDAHRNKHYPPSGDSQPGAPGNYEEMMQERRRNHKYGPGAAGGAGKVDNDWDGDGHSDWEGAAEGIDDDGQRALVWFLDWSGALTRPQLHMAAARLCTAGPWLMMVALCLFALIAGFHMAAASVARKLRVHPWYVEADARRRQECAARRAARRGVDPSFLPPAAAGGVTAATAPTVPAAAAVADPTVTYRYVPGQGFLPNPPVAPAQQPARVWSAISGLWRSNAGYERVPVAPADPEVGHTPHGGVEMTRMPTGFAVATASGPRVGGAAPAPQDVDPKAPIAYDAPAGLYPTAVMATGVPMGAIATGTGHGWAVAAPVAVGGAPSHASAYTYAAMPPRQ